MPFASCSISIEPATYVLCAATMGKYETANRLANCNRIYACARSRRSAVCRPARSCRRSAWTPPRAEGLGWPWPRRRIAGAHGHSGMPLACMLPWDGIREEEVPSSLPWPQRPDPRGGGPPDSRAARAASTRRARCEAQQRAERLARRDGAWGAFRSGGRSSGSTWRQGVSVGEEREEADEAELEETEEKVRKSFPRCQETLV